MININQYVEDKINIWFEEHPEEKKFLDDFVEKNNLQKQSLGVIILKMSNKDRKRFVGLIRMLTDSSREILKTMGLI